MTAVHNQGPTGIGDGLLIALAYEYTDERTSDLDAAYRGVKAALETVCDMQARAELRDNTDAALPAIRAEVARRNNAGDVDAAGAMIDAAIEQESAGMVALLEMGVQQDRLRNAPEDPARRLVQQVNLNTPVDRFTALRALQDVWYERRRDAGVAFDLIVSITIARTTLSCADTPDEKGAALNDLGVALSTLGARETGIARLDEAVTAYRNALLEYTRDRVPLDWAMTQNNLGNALQTLEERETGTARLDEAVTAYRDALLEITRDRVPLDWAVTQHCLSGLELAFYDKSKDPERLDQAKQNAQAAREVYSKAKAAHYVEWIDGRLAEIQSRRA